MIKENKTLEYKEEINEKFLKTVSAFANYETGKIVFGVTDKADVKGLKDLDNLCLKIENMINDSISPKPRFEIETGEKIISLTVFKGDFTPYLYKGKAYRRSDTATVIADEIEYKRLVLEGMHLYYEEITSNRQNLHFDYFEKQLQNYLNIKGINKDILKTLNLYEDEKGYNKAALLVSDENDFPGIDCARFKDNLNIILDRETYENESVLLEFDKAISMFKRYYSYEEISGERRETKFDIPLEAFREGLANALVHRIWDVNARIRIFMFPDRIEIVSPGGLPKGITREEYLNGQVSQLRNPILANIFFRFHIIEMFGTGITKIRNAYRDTFCNPIFDIYENSIKITLPVLDYKPMTTVDEENVYELLNSNRILATSDLLKDLSFGKDKTIKILDSLIEKNLVESVGEGRGRKYRKRK